MDSTPLVCITGQVRSGLIGTDAFQEIDATGITMPIVKHSWLVQDVEELPSVLKAAFHVARTGRQGPVLVDIAKDAQEAELDFEYPDDVDLPGWKPPLTVDERAVRAAAHAIAAAERPIVYAGGGVLNGDACAELRALVEQARLPAVVTLMGKGCLPDSHPLNYGPPGMHGSKYANWALNKADLVIAVGSRFDDRVTGKVSAFAPDAKVIHFDVDAAEVGKIREADIPVVGPLKQALDRPRGAASRRATTSRGCDSSTSGARGSRTGTRATPGSLKPQTVVETLRDLTAGRDDVVWTTGVGQHQMWAMQYLVCDRPRSFITSGGLGTMGYGVPAAIGAKAARPDATVVCIDGDGCFQMTSQELATAALERLPIVVVIVNNGWLGMVRQWQELFYDERYSETHLTHQVPDYAQLAEAYGCAGFTVDNDDDLESTLAAALAAGRTAVVDARCDPNENCYPMVPAGAAAVDVREAPEPEAAAHMSEHTLSVKLENKPGALARVSQLFARRGYNIQSLAVGPTEDERRLAADAARRLQRAFARADREADAQARERAPRQRAAARGRRRTRARARHRCVSARRARGPARRGARLGRGGRRLRRRRDHVPDRRPPRGRRRVRGAAPPARDPRARAHGAHRAAPSATTPQRQQQRKGPQWLRS